VKKLIILASLILATTVPAKADQIEANWKRPNGIIVRFSKCGSQFCASPITGPNAGKSAGKMASIGNDSYKGTLNDLENNKTYSGKASVSGSTLTVAGCVFGGLICKSESWAKQ
jgi:uncharacterized protein (DUF2147 family)